MAWPWTSCCARARRRLRLLLIAVILVPGPIRAQDPTAAGAAPTPRHPAVCADGVQRYAGLASVPHPFDTLTFPKGLPPIRITNPEQAGAAERQMAERAGRIGATGMVTVEESQETDGGARMVRRRVIPVFVPADSARAQAACRGPVGQPKRMPPDSSY
jgi:hypothetical protein